jgi:hypothetical protein
MRTPPADAQRCRAMSNKSGGGRCGSAAVAEGLCPGHLRHGSVQPDEWTQPDNLPVFHRPPPRHLPVFDGPQLAALGAAGLDRRLGRALNSAARP